jgi:modulator of FtsH protease HflK
MNDIFRQFPRSRGGPGDVAWDRLLLLAAGAVVGLLLLYVLFHGFYTVDPHQKAVVLRFGKYHATVEPGLRFCIPLVDTVYKVSIEEHSLRLPFGFSSDRPSTAREETTLMLTADLNAASVEWTIQWQVTNPEQYLFRFFGEIDPRYTERVISTVAETVMNRLVGDYSIDEVLTEKRGEIADKARHATQKILAAYECGVTIRDLQMQRVSPPEKVRPAFDQVNASIQQRDQLENEANKERNRLLPQALAEKDKTIRTAQGYADRRRAETAGEIKSLLARYRAYQKNPDVTKQRLYLETMQKVLAEVGSKTIIDAQLSDKTLPLLPLDKSEKGGTR